MKLKTKYSFNEALKTFTKLYSLNRNMHEALLQRGICLVRLNRLEEALIEINTYIDLVPNNLQAFFELCFILSSLGKYQEAIEANNKVLQRIYGICFDNEEDYSNYLIKQDNSDLSSFNKSYKYNQVQKVKLIGLTLKLFLFFKVS